MREYGLYKSQIEERAVAIANYIIEVKATVRQAAKEFGVSKSTVHKDVTERLEKINPTLADKIRSELKDKEDRSAYFFCGIILYHQDGTYEYFEGKTTGTIIDEERGNKDFGYDCIFLSDDLNETFGEATEEEKNSVSHRARALEQLKQKM